MFEAPLFAGGPDFGNEASVSADDEARALARQFSEKLAAFADRARQVMPADAIADAFMGATLAAAAKCLPRAEVAAWLRMYADELEKPEHGPRAH